MVVQVYSLDAEFSKPMWVFGVSSYAFLGNDDQSQKIVCCYRLLQFSVLTVFVLWLYVIHKDKPIFLLSRQNGKSYVGLLDHDSGSFSKIDLPFSAVTNIVSANSDDLP